MDGKEVLGKLIMYIIIIVGCISLVTTCFSGKIDSRSSSLPKDPSQMTNKQFEQFLEWNEKQNKLEYDNAPAFK